MDAGTIRDLAAVLQSVGAATEDLDIKVILERIVEGAVALVGSRYAALGVLGHGGEYDYFVPVGIEVATFARMRERHGLPRGEGLLGHLSREGKPLRVDEITRHPASCGFPEGHPVMTSLLGVPVLLHDGPIGRLFFSDKLDGTPFTQEDEDLAAAFATIAALGINNARRLKGIQQRNAELEAVSRVAAATRRAVGLEEMLHQILRATLSLDLLGLEHKGAFFLRDTAGESLRLAASQNFSPGQKETCALLPYGECLCGMCAVQEEILLSSGYLEDTRHTTHYEGVEEHGHIVLPLKVREQLLGVLCLYLAPGTTLSDRQIGLCRTVADIAAVAIQEALNLEKIETLASFPEADPHLVLECSPGGAITYLNSAGRQLLAEMGLAGQTFVPPDIAGIALGMKRSGAELSYLEVEIEDRTFGQYLHLAPDRDAVRIYAVDVTERKKAEAALRRHRAQLLALNQASTFLLDAGEPDATEDIYHRISRAAHSILDVAMVWVGIVEEGRFEVEPVAVTGVDDGYLDGLIVRFDDSPEGMGPTGMALKTRQPWVADDIEKDPRFNPWREKALRRGFRSCIAVPLLSGVGAPVGTLNLYSREPYFFTEDQVMIVRAFAHTAGAAIENVRLMAGLERKVEERTRELEDMTLKLVSTNRELEMRRMEAEEARVIAESAGRAKSEFLANTSHELRTPLNAIIGFSELMSAGAAGDLTAEQKDYLKDINDSGRLLLSLINDILDLSKVEAGMMQLEYTEVDLRDLIESSLIFFREEMMKHDMEIEVEVEEAVGLIRADDRRLRQVITNLLSNAVKFAPAGGRVSVRARRVEPEAGGGSAVVEVGVADSGPGIAPRDIPRLFQPFQQLDSPYGKKSQGTGLGLALCRRIVEHHGGTIWVESGVGDVNVFKFRIPVAETMGMEVMFQSSSDSSAMPMRKEQLRVHVRGLISLHVRKGKPFGLLRVESIGEDPSADLENLLASTIRGHDLFALGEVAGEYYLVFLETDRNELAETGARILALLEENGLPCAVRTAVFPEDGKTPEGLLAELDDRT
ncbi:MAG: GAF domain-containing protein [Actinobacteria bacterium]|nr:GAF domain-containing protein [Actinomycetota bacterium]